MEGREDQLAKIKRSIAERRYDDAIRACRRLLVEAGPSADARILLGEALLAADRYEDARVEMASLLREQPNIAVGQRLLGEAYLRQGQHDKAQKALRRAIELEPDDEAAHELMLEATTEAVGSPDSTMERWLGKMPEDPATQQIQLPEARAVAPAAKLDAPVGIAPAGTAPVGTAAAGIAPAARTEPSRSLEAREPSSRGNVVAGSPSRALEPSKPRVEPSAPRVEASAPRSSSSALDDFENDSGDDFEAATSFEAPSAELEAMLAEAAQSQADGGKGLRALLAQTGNKADVPGAPKRTDVVSSTGVPRSGELGLAPRSGGTPLGPRSGEQRVGPDDTGEFEPPTQARIVLPEHRGDDLDSGELDSADLDADMSGEAPLAEPATRIFTEPKKRKKPADSSVESLEIDALEDLDDAPEPTMQISLDDALDAATGKPKKERTSSPGSELGPKLPAPIAPPPKPIAPLQLPGAAPPPAAPPPSTPILAIAPRAALPGSPAAALPGSPPPAPPPEPIASEPTVAPTDVAPGQASTFVGENPQGVRAPPPVLGGAVPGAPVAAPPPVFNAGVSLGTAALAGGPSTTPIAASPAAALPPPVIAPAPIMPSPITPSPLVGAAPAPMPAPTMDEGDGFEVPPDPSVAVAAAPGGTTRTTRRLTVGDQLAIFRQKLRGPNPGRAIAAELREKPGIAIGLVGGLALLVVSIITIVSSFQGPNVDDLFAHVSDEGRVTDFVAAIQAVNESTDEHETAVAALLFASATFDVGEDRLETAERKLSALGVAVGTLPEARVAQSLTLLARGRATEALAATEGVEMQGIVVAEAFRARARALMARGQLAPAVQAAEQALAQRPGTPRHSTLVAYYRARAGHYEEALAALELPGSDQMPAVKAVRAYVLARRGGAGDLEAATTEAAAVMGGLSSFATTSEKVLARFARALALMAQNQREDALTELRDAAGSSGRGGVLPFDEVLVLDIARALVHLEAYDDATTLLARLPEQSADSGARAQLLVEIALARLDFPGAQAALRNASPGPASDILAARVAEGEGRFDDAIARYTTAAGTPEFVVEAHRRRGALLVRMGQIREARDVLQLALASGRNDPDLVATYARVLLLNGQATEAQAQITSATSAHPEHLGLQAVSALLSATRGDRDRALSQLRRLAPAMPTDVDVRLDLANVARASANREVETSACDDALRIDSHSGPARLCVARVATDNADFERAHRLIDEAKTSGYRGLEVARAEAQLLASEGRGQSGLNDVQGFLEAHPNDPVILAARARLELQSEDGRRALTTAQLLLRLDSRDPEGLFASAYAGYLNRSRDTSSYITGALEEGTRRGMPFTFMARVQGLRALIAFDSSTTQASQQGTEAAARDPHCGIAQLALALVADAQHNGEAFQRALRAAGVSTDPPAEVIARLATLETSDQRCQIANRYLRMAPRGWDASSMQRITSRGCP